MNMYNTKFKKTLSPLMAWSFTENKWLRRFLGITYVTPCVTVATILTLLISPYILWDSTLKDLLADIKIAIVMIGEWF